MPLPLLGGGWE
ncbi:hypothetical protein VCHC71A1_03147A, partial [Vibrio cholerae HC-71A1]